MKKSYAILFISMCLTFASYTSTAQGIPAREESNLDQVYSAYDLTGEGVIVAIIDRGIDYYHPDFIDENGNTRILYLYDMINPAGANNPDNPYGIGTIFTEDEINTSLETDGPPLSMDRFGHGTATSGIAAGNGTGTESREFHGVAPKAKLIVVKAIQDNFPSFDGQPGQDGFYEPSYIPVALQFVADKAGELPTVALLNMGSIGGPTDGTSTISRAMNDFVDQGHTLVCGVGDDGGSENHAMGTVNLNETVEVKIDKGETGNLRFELWYSEDDRFEVTVTRPDNTFEGPFTAPATADDSDDRFLTGMNYYHRGANTEFYGATSNRRMLMIDLTGATGQYIVSLKGTTINASGDFHATLNASTYSNTNKFNSHIVEGYALNDFTSAEKVISPTDYVVKNDWVDMDGNNRQMNNQGDPGELWVGSSWGPTQDDRMAVDFAACGEVLYAAYSAGTWYSHFPWLLVQGGENQYGIQNAVSAAAPLTTGTIALLLQMRPEISPLDLKLTLQATAREDSFTGTTPNSKWGYGKLDAYAAAQVVETLGISDAGFTREKIDIYPNPSSTDIRIKLNTKAGKNDQILITNQLGQTVKKMNINGTSEINIQISELPKGVYQVLISGVENSMSGKFIKL